MRSSIIPNHPTNAVVTRFFLPSLATFFDCNSKAFELSKKSCICSRNLKAARNNKRLFSLDLSFVICKVQGGKASAAIALSIVTERICIDRSKTASMEVSEYGNRIRFTDLGSPDLLHTIEITYLAIRHRTMDTARAP